MEFVSFFWIVSGLLVAGIFFVVCGILFAVGGREIAFFSLLVAGLLIICLVESKLFELGRLAERRLDQSHYVVIAKGQSSFGTPLLVRDIISKEERTIVSKKYPPAGFIEVTTADGKTMLLPKEK